MTIFYRILLTFFSIFNLISCCNYHNRSFNLINKNNLEKTFNRTTTSTGLVSNWTLKSLNPLKLRNGTGRPTDHKIPTLEEALHVSKDKILINLDKCSDYIDVAYKTLEKTDTVDQVIFKGTKDINHVRKQYGENILSKIIYMPIISMKTPGLKKYITEFINEYEPGAFEIIFKSDDSKVLESITNIKKSGSGVWINTLWESLCSNHTDDRAVYGPDGSWGWILEKGATIIQTDRPELLLDYLERGCTIKQGNFTLKVTTRT